MKKAKQSLLWKVTSPSSDKISYLFGTMHLLDEYAFEVIQKIKPFLLECNTFAAETDLDDLNALPKEMIFLPEGKTMHDFLTEKRIIKIKTCYEKIFSSPFEGIKNLHPLFISQIFNRYFIDEDPKSFDNMLWELADNNGKIIFGIEKADEQMEIFKKIDIENQYKQLWLLVKNFSRYSKSVKKTLVYYKSNDAYRLYLQGKKGLKELRKNLLYERNQKMAMVILDYLYNDSTFVTFGAGHLLGQKGIVRIIKKAGYDVEPLDFITNEYLK